MTGQPSAMTSAQRLPATLGGDIPDRVPYFLPVTMPGGGFILSDSHGGIPLQVPEEILLAISDAAVEFGRYAMAAG